MRVEFYREFFAQCKSMLKISYFCKKVNVSPQNLSHFIKGYDNALSINNLSRLYKCVLQELEKIV